MTILHLRSSEFYGGPERAIVGQCRYFKSARLICASFVRPGAISEFLRKCNETGAATFEITERFTGDFGSVGQLVKLITAEQVDILVTHDYKANFFGRRAAVKCGTKQVAHFRGRTTEDRKVRLYNRLDDYLLKKIPFVIVVSEKSRELIAGLGVDSDRIIVVPNGFDMARALSEPRASSDSGKPLRIVAAGRLSREKGYDILIEALAKIKDKPPELRLEIYGEGPEQERLRQQVDRHGLSKTVTFCGFVPDLLPVFKEADLMVLPSRSEGMPNVVLEAWSQRLAVVAAAVGGLPEMIEDGRNGLLAGPEDSQDLADKISMASADRSFLRRLGQAGFETLAAHYSFESQAKLLDQVYRSILEAVR